MTTPNPTPDVFAAVSDTIRARRSIRRFLPTPVPREVLADLLALASHAPSGTNAQPWKVYALAGEARAALSATLLERFDQGAEDAREYDYYPTEWIEPWLSRRRKLGLDLYGHLGIPKDDKARMKAQTGRNYLFFDAPVGLIFTFDKHLGRGMFLDCGIFIAHLALAAQAYGLSTCIQNAFADYPATVRQHLGIPDQELILSGLALGYADPDAPENALRTEREPVEGFAEFRGF